ncbi:hypothetical protein WDU94_005670 [Cyamophila willieti]
MVASELYVLEQCRNGITTEVHLGTQVEMTTIKETKERLREITLDKWQQEWDHGDTGRITYAFLPNIRERLKMKLRLHRVLTRVLTGHCSRYGDYRRRILKQPGQDGRCATCGEPDTVLHRIRTCPAHQQQRDQLRAVSPELDMTLLLNHVEGRRVLESFGTEDAVPGGLN